MEDFKFPIPPLIQGNSEGPSQGHSSPKVSQAPGCNCIAAQPLPLPDPLCVPPFLPPSVNVTNALQQTPRRQILHSEPVSL